MNTHTHTEYNCPVLHSTWLIPSFHLVCFMVSDDRPLGCYRWTECLSNPSKWQSHPHLTSHSNKTQLTVLIKEHKPWSYTLTCLHTLTQHISIIYMTTTIFETCNFNSMYFDQIDHHHFNCYLQYNCINNFEYN